MTKNPNLSTRSRAIICAATGAAFVAGLLALVILSAGAGLLLGSTRFATSIPAREGLAVVLVVCGAIVALSVWLNRRLDAAVARLAVRLGQRDTTS
jgi:hypothetical protein